MEPGRDGEVDLIESQLPSVQRVVGLIAKSIRSAQHDQRFRATISNSFFDQQRRSEAAEASKVRSKTTENEPQKRVGDAWEPPAELQEALRGPVESFEAAFGASECAAGCLGGVLGRFLRAPGAPSFALLPPGGRTGHSSAFGARHRWDLFS